MNGPVASPTVELPSERQVAALVTLLADDDPGVYETVRAKLLSYGQAAAGWLRPHVISSDPLLRRRAHDIVVRLLRQAADESFLGFCLTRGDGVDLEEGT